MFALRIFFSTSLAALSINYTTQQRPIKNITRGKQFTGSMAFQQEENAPRTQNPAAQPPAAEAATPPAEQARTPKPPAEQPATPATAEGLRANALLAEREAVFKLAKQVGALEQSIQRLDPVLTKTPADPAHKALYDKVANSWTETKEEAAGLLTNLEKSVAMPGFDRAHAEQTVKTVSKMLARSEMVGMALSAVEQTPQGAGASPVGVTPVLPGGLVPLRSQKVDMQDQVVGALIDTLAEEGGAERALKTLPPDSVRDFAQYAKELIERGDRVPPGSQHMYFKDATAADKILFGLTLDAIKAARNPNAAAVAGTPDGFPGVFGQMLPGFKYDPSRPLGKQLGEYVTPPAGRLPRPAPEGTTPEPAAQPSDNPSATPSPTPGKLPGVTRRKTPPPAPQE